MGFKRIFFKIGDGEMGKGHCGPKVAMQLNAHMRGPKKVTEAALLVHCE